MLLLRIVIMLDFGTFKLSNDELSQLNKDENYLVLVGEYLNKNKKDENGNPFNIKLVIFDILVKNGQYLLDTTFEEREKMLDEMFGKEEFNSFLYKISENIFRVKTFRSNFIEVWKELVKIELFEGLVLKKINGKLERGTREKNNVNTQLKARRSTRNYQF